MTNKRAISTLNSLKDYYNDKKEDSYVGFDSEDNEALDMAINALEIFEQAKEAGFRGEEVEFYIGGRKFAIRELAQ
jgi:hypothetical protein